MGVELECTDVLKVASKVFNSFVSLLTFSVQVKAHNVKRLMMNVSHPGRYISGYTHYRGLKIEWMEATKH